jgi:hypothetical protein
MCERFGAVCWSRVNCVVPCDGIRDHNQVTVDSNVEIEVRHIRSTPNGAAPRRGTTAVLTLSQEITANFSDHNPKSFLASV